MEGTNLATRLLDGDVRALARAIRMVEERDPSIAAVLREVRGRTGRAQIIGVTGSPGSGKSTLCDQLIERWRAQGHLVGVIAVDPSSPFSGGAILGDRVRMQRHATDAGVFIRSMAARGHLGGLAGAAREAVRLLDASGRDRCLLETVGVGQSELEVMRVADTTVVVTTPVAGDAVQAMKAGILEIADIFVVNKADLPGAAKVYRDLRDLVRQTKAHAAWAPPVVLASAQKGDGVDELIDLIDRHHNFLTDSGELERRRAQRVRSEVESIVIERAAQRARQALDQGTMGGELGGDLREVDPYELAEQILNGHTKESAD
ncbi:MAG TPA: methylmalonyl Co-A mutase-associated GTPase MeaB [Candidatus Acidoferrales bacterium]|nr:methylmalonyl Co-A mutase-associated GTPase MeaB [Candidatus Acidoferrales bacterium]